MSAPTPFLTRLGQSPSALVLILANLIPLGGVIFFHWSAFDVVFLFWLENVVIGVFNVLKMLVYGAIGSPSADQAQMPRIGLFLGMGFMAIFFTFHYGMFCFVHGIFVFALLHDVFTVNSQHGNPFDMLTNIRTELTGGLGSALAALVLSHGFSFGMNFIRNREYQKITGGQLMAAPYGRIVVLHIAIIFGAFAIIALKSPVGLVALLVVLKIGLDLALHLKERQTGAINLAHLVAKRNNPSTRP